MYIEARYRALRSSLPSSNPFVFLAMSGGTCTPMPSSHTPFEQNLGRGKGKLGGSRSCFPQCFSFRPWSLPSFYRVSSEYFLQLQEKPSFFTFAIPAFFILLLLLLLFSLSLVSYCNHPSDSSSRTHPPFVQQRRNRLLRTKTLLEE